MHLGWFISYRGRSPDLDPPVPITGVADTGGATTLITGRTKHDDVFSFSGGGCGLEIFHLVAVRILVLDGLADSCDVD